MSAVLEATGLRKHYPVRRGALQRLRGVARALDGVDLSIAEGECFGLVGESGSGKTTLGRCLMRLIEPTAGSVRFRGRDLTALRGAALRRERRHFQMIFQDPYGSLDPRMRVGAALEEPLAVHRIGEPAERPDRVAALLDMVGLPAGAARRYPHEFSGGQRQRIGIARALATEPALVVADEPVSALDVSIRAQILNLLADLQARLSLTLLFIAHDLAVVEHLADRVGVLYLGRLVEVAPAAELFARPLHPYTVALLEAVPLPDPGRRGRARPAAGEPPSLLAPPPGCPYHPRCPIARSRCSEEHPPLSDAGAGRSVACHFPGELEPELAPADGTFSGGPRSTGQTEGPT